MGAGGALPWGLGDGGGLISQIVAQGLDSVWGQAEPEIQPGPAARTGRRKLWEIQSRFRCPVIGTCLGVAELRRIGARYAARWDEPATDYEVHVSFVGAAEGRNSLSLATHKAMDRKFRGTLKRFERARDPQALRALWADCLARGEVAGAFWALMTHPRSDATVLRLAYEEVHMLSHQVGASQRADLKRLSETQLELESLSRDYDALCARSRRQSDEREGLIRNLEEKLALRDGELARQAQRERTLAARLAALERAARGERLSALETRLAETESALAQSREGELRAREGLLGLKAALEAETLARQRQARECEALERVLAEGLGAGAADGGVGPRVAGSCDDCPNLDCARRDLGGRSVLCVGGLLPQVQQFGRLVRECNGRFDHHDGGLEDGDRRLEALLAGADLVVCATDFVSHTAYRRTKRFCKRNEKPHVLLQRSGLAAFALALERAPA
jgi:hypothetical protein